ncbi:MAG: hypothetical protein GC137_05950 [Alphaproteobacteria bacterium]|nr:hypothetical protein [Alphaproteobacteria bacterium]
MKYTKIIIITIVFLHLFAFKAYAEEIAENKFTGLELEEYFAENQRIYTGDKPDIDSIRAFNKQYAAKDYLFSDTVRDNRTAKEHVIEQTYAESITMQEFDQKELLNSKLKHNIHDIEYKYDRSIAIVRFSSTFSGDIKLPGKNVNLEDKLALVSFKTLSRCEASFRIEEEGLKTYRLDCLSDVIYDKPVPIKE